ncbi:MAG: NAD-dependent epimerase/dehydratase family protein [Phycisphaerales bacterium]|nr:NAD-dependent epimerase/dehydratase family protein [Phycisphaerales bacterium]
MFNWFEGRRVCVTGGAGFIGAHLVQALLRHGADVSVIDDLSGGDAQRIAQLVEASGDRLRFVYASILDPVALHEAMHGAEVVFHLAAMVSVMQSMSDPDRCFAVNADGTERIAEAARRAGVRRWVYASSSAVYGDRAALPLTETGRLDPRSPYAASKAAGEHIVRAWSESYGLAGLSLRFFNVYGPGQPAHGTYAAMIPAFLAALRAGEAPTIFGDGSATRDLIYVNDVVQAILLGASGELDPGGQAINIGTGRATAVLDVAERLVALCAPERKIRFAPEREGEVRHSCADVAAAARLLGFAATTSLDEALVRTAESFGCPRATAAAAGLVR